MSAITAPPAAEGSATRAADRAADHAAAVDAYLEDFFARSLRRTQSHPADYRRLWAAARNAASGGKRIRPRLVLAAHDAFAGASSEDAVALAGAFELLHTAFLMHDDVIDHDFVRRGEPNVAGRFALDAALLGAPERRAQDYGRASAILAGDLLLAAAHTVAASLEAPADVRRAVIEVIDDCVFAAAAGEHADVRHALGELPDEHDIIGMIEDKTACYSFSAPLRAGGLLGGADTGTVARLGEIGRRMGIAFQLRDDLLGVYGDERVTGKSALGDLREGKQTLLIAYARSHAAWIDVSHGFGSAELDETGARGIRDAIERSGARLRVEALIASELDAALRLIREPGLPAPLAATLTALAHAEPARRR
ncbi:polyprenyl synthetase family protein [Agromyces soli]